ncbi:S4 domain-containing protein YaaA [Virgibacillus proomii]|uniref:S4 domain-containing protein YaaA n=1 Tax=Virgibacillus proomii TaxID=84407 RepID=UPI002814BDA1|nr:S4 domain-containing protein YaaA [Virgibacillus proomii]
MKAISRKMSDYMCEKITIKTDYIPLGQFIKLINIFDSGGMIKGYIQDVGVVVNREREHRRGKKLYPDDIIEIDDVGRFQVVKEAGT